MPMTLSGFPLFAVFAGFALVALFFWLRTWLGYRTLPGEAGADWDYRRTRNMQDLRLTRNGYIRAYQKVHAPRASLYTAAAMTMILLLTPVILMLINGVLWLAGEMTRDTFGDAVEAGRPHMETLMYERGNLVWGFLGFFGLVAFWAVIAATVARHYHRNAPGLMRDALIEERAQFTPDQPLTIGPNPAHVLANAAPGVYKKVFADSLGLSREVRKNWNGRDLAVDIYSDTNGAQLIVHHPAKPGELRTEISGYLVRQKHKREVAEEIRYQIIILRDNIQSLFNSIENANLELHNVKGTPRMRSFAHQNLDIFLYENREEK